MSLRSALLVSCVALAVAGCGGKAEPKPAQDAAPTASQTMPEPSAPAAASERPTGPDPHSFAQPGQVRVEHMGLAWTVSFDQKRLDGVATLLLDRKDPQAPLLLDTRDLEVSRVAAATLEASPGEHGVPELAIGNEQAQWSDTKFRVGKPVGQLGAPLEIDLPEKANAVRIEYRTIPAATGLQWLAPEQTAGKKHPFLYSQSQAIHARSWIPCQDSPGIRVTYDARVEADAELDAVMAAQPLKEHEAAGEKTVHRFVMPQRIPPYLIAIGVGDLEFRELGPRTGVWADPTVLEAASNEFGDMERMLDAAEALYGPYRWGRYDVLVLPPAFPFGGMENPRLTFATPTILAGDRSLVSLIAHELAHSWSGNLVTNATWSDLWLNEGFTVYFERRIVEALYGPERAQVEAALGRQDLERELADDLKDRPEDQKLRIDLRGRDPDDNFSAIPYEKGAFFLMRLEEAYGRERFDAFLRGWFERNAFDSATTDDFVAYLKSELLDAEPPAHGKAPALKVWLEEPGLPPDAPDPSAAPLERVDAQTSKWLEGQTKAAGLPFGDWTTHERLHFLRGLPEDISAERLGELDQAFSITDTGNSEVLDEWLCIAARRGYAPAEARTESFLLEVGRRKFLTPLYKALLETDAGKKRALDIYARARPGYHSISRGTLDELLGWTG
jgi:aminopeptidase N